MDFYSHQLTIKHIKEHERLIQMQPILNNVPFMCGLIVCHLPPFPFDVFFVSPHSDSSRSGKFYLQMNSAPPPAVAGSTGSAHISAKQTVNSRSVP